MLKICFIWLQGIIVNKGLVPFCIRSIESVKLSQCNSLYNCESFGTAVFKIFFCILLVQAMKKFPAGVAEIEERSSILKNKKPSDVRNFKLSVRQIG